MSSKVWTSWRVILLSTLAPMLRFDNARFGKILLHVVIAFSVFLSSATSVRRITEIGKQCPTAAIQLVEDKIQVKTACGCVIEKKVLRAPKFGETGFKQCECAEKKSQKSKTQVQTEGPLVWFFSKPFIPEILVLRIPRIDDRFEESASDLGVCPSIPPPLAS